MLVAIIALGIVNVALLTASGVILWRRRHEGLLQLAAVIGAVLGAIFLFVAFGPWLFYNYG